MRELALTESKSIAGGYSDYVEVYPPYLPGKELIGWTEEIVGYDTYSWTEYKGLFTEIVHVETYPIYQINPIYGPASDVIIYY